MSTVAPPQGVRRWSAHAGFWLVLSVLLLAVSGFCSHFGLFGDFTTTAFGVSCGAVWDPGGPYLASGTLLFRSDKAAFFGHPGLILQTFAGTLGETSYFLARHLFDCPAPYPRFIAKNWYWIILISRLVMTGCHLLCFYLLSRLCARFWEERLTSHVAVLACLTTYPVLFYLNHVAPEPFLCACVLTALLLAWRWGEARQAGRPRFAWVWFALSALACAGACCCKFMLGVPATVGVALYYVIESNAALSKPRRVLLGLAFLVLCAFFVVGISQKVDWGVFFSEWGHYTPGLSDHPAWSPHPADNASLTARAIAVVCSTAAILRPILSPAHWFPAWSPHGLLCAAELVFVPLALAGTVLLFRRLQVNRRKFCSILLVVICISPMVVFRDCFNYYIIPLTLGSIPFAFALTTILKSVLRPDLSLARQWAVMAVAVGLIHLPGIIFVADAKRRDIQMHRWYAQCYFSGLRQLDYEHRIGLTETDLDVVRAVGLGYRTDPEVLKEAVRSFFYPIPAGTPRDRLPDDVRFVIDHRTLIPVTRSPTTAPTRTDGA